MLEANTGASCLLRTWKGASSLIRRIIANLVQIFDLAGNNTEPLVAGNPADDTCVLNQCSHSNQPAFIRTQADTEQVDTVLEGYLVKPH